MAPREPTALLLTALPLEMAAVLAHMSEGRSARMAGPVLCEIGYFTALDGLSWRVVAAEVGPGTVDTAGAVVAVAASFQPDVLMFVGIAGALKDDVQVGDVVAGTEVAWTERGRWSQSGYLPRVRTASLSAPLSQLARKIARDGSWTRRLTYPRPGAKAVAAQIASGEKVVADGKYRAWLRSAFSDAVAIETEGFALARAGEVHADGHKYVVRGISDNADGSKSDHGHLVAAEAAAAFAFELLDAYSGTRATAVPATPRDRSIQHTGQEHAPPDRRAEADARLRTVRESARKAEGAGDAGDAAAARDQLAALLPVVEGALSAEHPQTLAVRNRLAHWTGAAGNPASARDQAALLLIVVTQVLGSGHPDTLAVRANLAHWTGQAGDPATARRLADELLPDFNRVFGPSHQATLAVRADIASMTRLAGSRAGALDQYSQLLPQLERILGTEHPDTLAVRAKLARSTGEARNKAGARDQFATLLPVLERVRGPEHPDTLNARAGLVRWTASSRNPAEARDQFAALLPLFQRVRGPEHPDTLYIRHSIARWTGAAGDPAAARARYAELLPIQERILGPSHPDTETSRDHLTYWASEADEVSRRHMSE